MQRRSRSAAQGMRRRKRESRESIGESRLQGSGCGGFRQVRHFRKMEEEKQTPERLVPVTSVVSLQAASATS